LKSLAAYYFLLLYTTVALKPFLPLVGDALSHAFAKAEHISTVHADHGDHHLEHELAEAGEEHGHEQNPTLPKAEDLIQSHLLVPRYVVGSGATDFNRNYSLLIEQKLPAIFLTKQGPPPKIFLLRTQIEMPK
jgi:hypothetical protein